MPVIVSSRRATSGEGGTRDDRATTRRMSPRSPRGPKRVRPLHGASSTARVLRDLGTRQELRRWIDGDHEREQHGDAAGAGVGLATEGMRPVGEMQFADFVSCGFDAVVNVAGKLWFRQRLAVPLVLRLPSGGGFSGAPAPLAEPRGVVHVRAGAEGGGAVDGRGCRGPADASHKARRSLARAMSTKPNRAGGRWGAASRDPRWPRRPPACRA